MTEHSTTDDDSGNEAEEQKPEAVQDKFDAHGPGVGVSFSGASASKLWAFVGWSLTIYIFCAGISNLIDSVFNGLKGLKNTPEKITPESVESEQ